MKELANKIVEINNELFYPIKEFEDRYLISKTSKIYGIKSKKILKPLVDKEGYLYIIFIINKKNKNLKIHRLMALTFLENPENKKEVNHIDCNNQNNNLENLEWSTRKENHNHSYVYGKLKKIKCCKVENGAVMEIYNSYNEASMVNGIDVGSIRYCCLGKAGVSNGICFRLYDEINGKYIKTEFDLKTNKRATLMITYKNNSKSINEWSEIFNISVETIRDRYRRGLREDELFKPTKKYKGGK